MKKLRNILSSVVSNKLLCQAIAFGTTICAMMIIFSMQIFFNAAIGYSGSRIVAAIIMAIFESAVLILPFIWWRQLRYLMLPAVWLIGCFFVVNIAYVRFNHDLPQWLLITMASNLGTVVAKSTSSLLRITDFTYLIVAGVFTVYWVKCQRIIKREHTIIPRPQKKRLTFIGIGVLMLWQLIGGCFTWYFYHTSIDAPGNSAGYFTMRYKCLAAGSNNEGKKERSISYLDSGLTIYSISSLIELIDFLNIAHELTEEQRIEVEEFLDYYSGQDYTQLFPDNGGKNLILILVESLNSEVIGMKINGVEVTPTLNELIDMPGTISALDVVSQARAGVSSDGQLLINTGILPLSKGSAAMSYGLVNSYPTLVEALRGYESVAIFTDSGDLWDKRTIFTNFGFKKVMTSSDLLINQAEAGDDAALFDLMTRIVPELEQPFFIEGLTMSMHYAIWPPEEVLSRDFADAVMPGEKPLSKDQVTYLRATQYFDKELGTFIENLKAMNLWDDTILIITSDHSLTPVALNPPEGYIPIAFIAANTGETIKIDRTVGQVNLFPAILDIMSVKAGGKYRGMGESIFDSSLNGAINNNDRIIGSSDETGKMEKAGEISDLIIHTNYFGK